MRSLRARAYCSWLMLCCVAALLGGCMQDADLVANGEDKADSGGGNDAGLDAGPIDCSLAARRQRAEPYLISGCSIPADPKTHEPLTPQHAELLHWLKMFDAETVSLDQTPITKCEKPDQWFLIMPELYYFCPSACALALGFGQLLAVAVDPCPPPQFDGGLPPFDFTGGAGFGGGAGTRGGAPGDDAGE